jgi:enamine deaminase RidA (YjgF/YER057c/UK114 family)
VIRRIRSGGPFEPRVGYCRAVVAGDWIHVSGTVGQDHETGALPEGAVAQCRLALEHIRAALAEAGASLTDAVRVTYILPDRTEFEPCWSLLREAFGEAPPAATMIEAGLADPAMRIEIEVTAYRPAASG